MLFSRGELAPLGTGTFPSEPMSVRATMTTTIAIVFILTIDCRILPLGTCQRIDSKVKVLNPLYIYDYRIYLKAYTYQWDHIRQILKEYNTNNNILKFINFVTILVMGSNCIQLSNVFVQRIP